MNRSILGVGAAALVVLAAAGALTLFRPAPGVGGPAPASPSASPTSSAAATASSAGPADGSLPEGPHVLWTTGVRMDVTIPAPGWFGLPNDGILVKDDDSAAPDGAGLIVFAGDPGGLYVYGDPCAWSGTRPDEPAETVDALVTALAAQASRDATAPVDATVGGYVGKSMTLHVPDDAVFEDCDRGYFASWGVDSEDPARYHQDPGQIDELWILDVEGELVVVDAAYYEGTPDAVVEEMRAIVESMTLTP